MKENDFFLPPKKKNGDVVLFMFLFFLLLPGFSIAQYKAQLNIDIKNGTLVNVFENIQKQSAYRFMYSNQVVAAIKNISEQREGVSVQEILDIVLKGHNLTYLIEDKIIFIKIKITYLFSVMESIPFAIRSGKPVNAITHDIIEDNPIINVIIPVIFAESTTGSELHLI